jgi:AcrR family transcriptional regulator
MPLNETFMPPSARPVPSPASSSVPAAPGRRTQTQRRNETQRKILDTAIAILRAKGYAGLRTVDVADLAGVSRGALTHHFPSKELLVAGALQDVFVRAAQQGLTRAHGRPTVEQAVEALLDDYQDFYFSGFFLIAIELTTASGSDSEIAEKAREISTSNRAPVEAAWTKALTESGMPKKSAKDIVLLTGSIVRGLAVRKLLKDDPPSFKRQLTLWRQMVKGLMKDHLSAAKR